MASLAENIPGATTELVKKVLDEYGDPIDETQSTAVSESPTPDSSRAGPPDTEGFHEDGATPAVEELSAKQRETLRKIDEEPMATQREIGDALGVTAATISNRLSDIAGFSWQDRQEFVSKRFGPPLVGDGHGQLDQVAQPELVALLEGLEEQLQELASDTFRSPLSPEFAHKVLHTCMKSDEFSEVEELELI